MDPPAERRRRLTHRALPAVGGLGFVSLVAGIMVGAGAQSAGERAAHAYAHAWERGDYAAMYRQLSSSARSRISERRLASAYRAAAATGTATSIHVGSLGGESGGAVRVPVAVRTRVFGTVRGDVQLPVSDDGVGLSSNMVFPGIPPGGAPPCGRGGWGAAAQHGLPRPPAGGAAPPPQPAAQAGPPPLSGRQGPGPGPGGRPQLAAWRGGQQHRGAGGAGGQARRAPAR